MPPTPARLRPAPTPGLALAARQLPRPPAGTRKAAHLQGPHRALGSTWPRCPRLRPGFRVPALKSRASPAPRPLASAALPDGGNILLPWRRHARTLLEARFPATAPAQPGLRPCLPLLEERRSSLSCFPGQRPWGETTSHPSPSRLPSGGAPAPPAGEAPACMAASQHQVAAERQG